MSNFDYGHCHKLYIDCTLQDIPKIKNKIINKQFTDYLDFLTPIEVPEPVMIGMDNCNRRVIVLKYIVDDKIIGGQTFFQRYTDDRKLWMGCAHYCKQLIYTEGTGVTEIQCNLLRDIINGKTVVLNDEHRPKKDHGFYPGMSVKIFDKNNYSNLEI